MNRAPQRAADGQAPKTNKAVLFVFVGGFSAMVLIGAGVGLFFAFGRGGDGRTDVGALEALRGVQAQLRPINACRMDLNTRTVGANQDRGTLRVYACNAERFASPVRFLDVPPKFQHLSFAAERSSAADPWKIRVDQSRVAFGELTQALEAIAPEVAAKYPGMRAAQDAREKAEKEAIERDQQDRERTRQKAKESYPSK